VLRTYLICNAFQHNGQRRRLVTWKGPSQCNKKDIASLVMRFETERKGDGSGLNLTSPLRLIFCRFFPVRIFSAQRNW
jgi:phosphoheptose isomerase